MQRGRESRGAEGGVGADVSVRSVLFFCFLRSLALEPAIVSSHALPPLPTSSPQPRRAPSALPARAVRSLQISAPFLVAPPAAASGCRRRPCRPRAGATPPKRASSAAPAPGRWQHRPTFGGVRILEQAFIEAHGGNARLADVRTVGFGGGNDGPYLVTLEGLVEVGDGFAPFVRRIVFEVQAHETRQLLPAERPAYFDNNGDTSRSGPVNGRYQ